MEIPNDHNGLCVITEVATATENLDGLSTIKIPKSGVLEVRNADIFNEWHNVEATRENGTPITSCVDFNTTVSDGKNSRHTTL